MSGQSDLTDLGASEEERKKQEAIRYSKGELVEDDNDSHLSDVSRLASDVAWKSGPIAGLHLKK